MDVKMIIRHPEWSACEQSAIINNNLAVILAKLPELEDVPDLVPVCPPPHGINDSYSEEVAISRVGQQGRQSNLSSQPVIDANLFTKTAPEKDRFKACEIYSTNSSNYCRDVNVTHSSVQLLACNSFEGDRTCEQDSLAESWVCVGSNSSESGEKKLTAPQ